MSQKFFASFRHISQATFATPLEKIQITFKPYRYFPSRLYSTPQIKPNLKLLSQLRQETQVSIIKAKEALIKHNNDYDKAIAWLLEDSKNSGVAKAHKLKERITKEGLVGVVVTKFGERFGEERILNGSRGAIVEVNCETDFVSRNSLFRQFVTQIASTCLLLSSKTSSTSMIQPISPKTLLSTPLLPYPLSNSTMPVTNPLTPPTVHESLVGLIGKLGENISLRRAEIVNFGDEGNNLLALDGQKISDRILVTGGYVHGGIDGDPYTGKIGGLVLIEVIGLKAHDQSKRLDLIEKINKLSRNIAMQVVGFNPKIIDKKNILNGNDKNIEDDEILLNQDFMIGGGSVEQVLVNFEKESGIKINILEFQRWENGEEAENVDDLGFVNETVDAAGLSNFRKLFRILKLS
ncbi:12623_t:CDS:2 [Acaulospora morrowiae]|uniref:Elongation factor Ts, mitochondrial n=1 Tax=Acaulospora morrowiae TaxID=94023 RepID=A0A9N8V8T3_9GLOM|nr:12623_t:CDS:2 [Acaulospora morrowiae]